MSAASDDTAAAPASASASAAASASAPASAPSSASPAPSVALPPLASVAPSAVSGGLSMLGASAQSFADDSSSLSAFLLSGLPALYKHSSRKHEALRHACVEAIAKIKADDKHRQDKAAKGVLVPPDSDANKYFLPLKLACDTGQAKLVALALDTMEKLIAYGYLDGNAPATDDGSAAKLTTDGTAAAATTTTQTAATANAASAPATASSSSAPAVPASADPSKRRLIHVMLETLYECSMYSDILVQRQVIKALLTTVSSVSCPVHDHGLLQAVTSLYQIYLQAGDETNRTTSRAALTQIFNLVFQRMEMFAEQLKKLDEAAAQQREADKAQSLQNNEGIPTASPSPQLDSNGDSTTGAASANGDSTQESAVSSTVTDGGADSSVVGSGSLDLDTSAVEAHAVEPSLGADESDGAEFGVPTPTGATIGSQSRSSPGLTPRSAPGKRGFCIVCGKPANHSCLQTRDSVCGMECKLVNLARKDPNRKQALSVRARIANKLQTLQNDAYYLLRALIKLSHKALLTSPPEQAAVDSKLLSLTLLLSVMNAAGPTFQSNKNFITLVKTDLVNCLLRNSAASQIESIFAISSSIFVAMLKGFKPHLHRSIGPMIDSIYLPYIQSANSSFEHKATSLQVLRAICCNHQLLVDLFLNYDCSPFSFNTFQKIAEVLEKTSQAKTFGPEDDLSAVVSEETQLTGEQEMRLKSLAMEALVGAMNSLAQWTTRIVKPIGNAMAEQVEHATHGNAGADGNVSGGELLPLGAGRSTALAAIGAAAAAAAMTSGGDDDVNSTAAVSRKGTLQVDDPCPSPSSSPNPPSGQTSLSTGAAMASSFSTTFHSLRLAKQKFDTGISKFNAKPKVGLAYLQAHGLLGDTPEDIARFFHANPTLDKVQLGDYMGDEHAFNKSVLYAYVDLMDFSCMSFDESIRAFVQGFRLPGEAQKIDRMMEKFAERYHKNNPGRFASADTAYVLAYSIIMLNTDAHNPGVKVRMTVDDFRKNTRGIDDGKDLDPAFMAEIYERITQNEIIMKNDPLNEAGGAAGGKKAGAGSSASNPKKRFHAFVKESQQMVRRTQELIKTTSNPKAAAAAAAAAGADANGAAAAAAKSLSRKEKQYLDEISSDRLDQPENATSASAAASGSAASSASASSGSAAAAADDASAADRKSGEKLFYEATDADADAIRPMFEILSFPSLATFSLHLETLGESAAAMEIVRLCLQGYKSAIQVANALEMQTSRLAFISSLKQFTYLGSGKQMRRRNIEAIAALLSLGSSPASGNHLKQSWFEVLQVISEVERLHLIANNSLRGREMDFRQELVSGTPASTGMGLLPSSGRTLSISAPPSMSMSSGGVKPETETLNSLQVHLIDPSMIDRVFACSAHLDGEAIVDFVQALRAVSEQELSSPHAPRVFSLQKMVEITYFNMNRIRVVWNRIWSQLLSDYFQRAGCHPHLHVSMYAIDSLRQLAMKFLEKDELASYQFQRHFFKPFEYIMSHNASMDIRELVLQCIERMIQAKVKNIKSGWLGVLQVLTVAANAAASAAAISGPGTLQPLNASGGKHHSAPASPLSLLTLAFSILSRIMQPDYFALVAETGLETMDECVNCLVTFGCTQFSPAVSTAAIQFLVECASSLNKEKEPTVTTPVTPAATAANGEAAAPLVRKDSVGGVPVTPRLNSLPSGSSPQQVSLKVWFLVLTGLSRMVSDPRVEVRSLALSTLFQILNAHGHVFSQSTWRAVFHGVLLPLFDDVRSANEAAHHSKHDAAASGRNSNASSGSNSPEMSRRVSREPDDAARTPVAATAAPNFTRASSVAVSPSHAAHSLVTPPGPNASALGHRPTNSSGGADARRRASMVTPPSAHAAAAASAQFDNSWLQTTCFTALSSLVELFARFHSSVHFLLPELLRLLNGCICQAHAEPLAKIGVRCLMVLLHKIGAELSVGDWWIVLKSCEESLQSVLPHTLLSAKLRAHLLLTPAASPTAPIYTSLVRPAAAVADASEAANASPEASASPDTATAASPSRSVSSTTDDASVTSSARSSPLSPHQRSVSAHIPAAAVSLAATSSGGAPGGAAVPPSLPFHLGAMLTRLKVQLWLSEAIFQSVMRFFPKMDMHVKGMREEATLNDEEQATGANAAAAASAADSAASSASSAASGPLVNPSDRRLVGCLLPSQALYAVDLLGDVLNFTHAFNADINLRRKLHSAGFFIPPPSQQQQQQQNGAGAGAAANTVPPSPAPVPLSGAAANGGFPLLSSPSPAPLHAPSQSQSQSQSAAAASAPKRLPQLFYHEAHTMRLAMDVLFRLVTEAAQAQAQAQGAASEPPAPPSLATAAPSELWTSELRLASCSDSASSSSSDLLVVSESRLMSLCSLVLRDYVSKTQSGQLVSLEFSDEILVGLVHNLSSFPRALFQRYLGRFFVPLTELIEYATAPTIRHAIRKLFADHIGPILVQQGIEVVQSPNSARA